MKHLKKQSIKMIKKKPVKMVPKIENFEDEDRKHEYMLKMIQLGEFNYSY